MVLPLIPEKPNQEAFVCSNTKADYGCNLTRGNSHMHSTAAPYPDSSAISWQLDGIAWNVQNTSLNEALGILL